ncbi:haloallkane dehalogenase [Oleiphilus messinensis]|uniref:Haloalkane dehalogenase n=1 Tax=Oleiphilus messinensis TaxID=141451 RepID=A0A1Y0IA51_9GAMM|nr:haloalkane dehalogenase [Oleiphilus messinensis]ARU57039.1 haloallkane dehalogenase [Oleiphilus messinensis]
MYESLRTPESRFKNLPDYPFIPNYIDVDGLRMHYVDEGDKSAPPVLMLHGEPSWSYLYRHMIPLFTDAGFRAVAPDLIGFGKSDKPVKIEDYTYSRHVNWLKTFIETLDLNDITLICQDWGALLGLRIATEMESRFSRIVVGNGFLPTGEQKVPLAFQAWKSFAVYSPVFPVGMILNAGTARWLSRREMAAYDAPFPSKAYKAGARAFPKLVPVSPDHEGAVENREAWVKLGAWNKPFLTSFSDGDPIMRGGDRYFQSRVPGAKGLSHRTVRGGHFLQEDSPVEFANAAIDLIRSTPN